MFKKKKSNLKIQGLLNCWYKLQQISGSESWSSALFSLMSFWPFVLDNYPNKKRQQTASFLFVATIHQNLFKIFFYFRVHSLMHAKKLSRGLEPRNNPTVFHILHCTKQKAWSSFPSAIVLFYVKLVKCLLPKNPNHILFCLRQTILHVRTMLLQKDSFDPHLPRI